ncbi:DUF421 domain-containing protein [Flaviflexus salsibiostraticola]|uniref:DUF421 domain-containing protein n=1 Tax=Flaviflexus salsibiostraticola TaxID=1282737 RepID=A0A3Q8WT43_9ACTO|nr:YetF domain-containing protein [Flaviflexus salsibiostraticola]AZN29544.1 DUF421 domain-containing protein [Flaviflexus salsibiostraticola]
MNWGEIVTPTMGYAELFLRGTAAYLGLTFLLRIVGRREAGGLGLGDLLVILLVVDAAGPGLLGEASTIGDSAILVVTVILWSVVIDAVSFRWPRLGLLFKPRPRPIIEDGRLNWSAMRRELMSASEVESQLRLHGVRDMSRVERAFIEPNGMVSIVMSEEPVNPEAQKHPDI